MDKEFDKACFLYEKAAKGSTVVVRRFLLCLLGGNLEAQTNLGYIYEHGNEHVEEDLEKALFWYQKAAKKG